MTTTALSGLLEYLRGTLTANNMRWVGEHLIEYANKEEAEQLRPYTMQEIDDMLDEAENAFEAVAEGTGKSFENMETLRIHSAVNKRR